MKATITPTHWKLVIGMAVFGAAVANLRAAGDLLPPFRVEADGKPIQTAGGNAVPCLVDFDGDGTWDLLVGQFEQGKMRVFRNIGGKTAPKFGAGVWFKAGGADARVPAG